jgi:hypothetical protein
LKQTVWWHCGVQEALSHLVSPGYKP